MKQMEFLNICILCFVGNTKTCFLLGNRLRYALGKIGLDGGSDPGHGNSEYR